MRQSLIKRKCTPVIPSRSNALNPCTYDIHLYKERHIIQCFFSKVTYFRRIFSRFDKSARNFASCIAFVGRLIWLR
ncbi:transposase [Candidatus Dependentiae bacterium]|nr:transposase [Candidatus Dependentiae bacterium]